ncbi:MAG: helix-turn-helix domain-containing protein [Gemmatimonadota bacterium]|nr:helix-turn-helix domain-containing protein [Gemmatimonadota bacterium]
MRPPAEKQNPLRTPLNEVFRSEGNVRVLRVLASTDEPIGRTRVARRAELNPSGVRRTLDRLGELGIVEGFGSGRNRSVRLRDRHPLASAIRSLFAAERDVYELFVDVARTAFRRQDISARAIWLENPDDRSPGLIPIGILASPEAVDEAREAVLSELEEIEEELAVHFVAHTYTAADRLALDGEEAEQLREVILLHGWLPQEWTSSAGGPIESHRQLDARARGLAEGIAALLPNDPSIVDRAREWIDRRLEEAGSGESRNLREWRRMLEKLSLQQIQAFLREESERADRLRQSMPFVEVLTPTERKRLLEDGP